MIRRPIGSTLSIHHFAASGSERRRSVSPVGAASTTMTSYLPESWWSAIQSRSPTSSMPGRTVISSAMTSSSPRQRRTDAAYSWIGPSTGRRCRRRPIPAPTGSARSRAARGRARGRTRRRGCGRCRSTARSFDSRARRRRAPWRRRRSSCRRRPCRCRRGCAVTGVLTLRARVSDSSARAGQVPARRSTTGTSSSTSPTMIELIPSSSRRWLNFSTSPLPS